MSKNVYEGLKRILFTLETSMYAQCCYVRQFRTLSRGQSHRRVCPKISALP